MFHRVRFASPTMHAASGSCPFAYVLTDVLLHDGAQIFVMTALVPQGNRVPDCVLAEWPSANVQWVEQNVLTFIESDWMGHAVFGSYVTGRSVPPQASRSWLARLWHRFRTGAPITINRKDAHE